MTYLDDDALRHVRRFPLYEERYLLLTPADAPPAGPPVARWAQAAALPLCLLSSRMRNRRIMDECFAADGVTASPAVETDSVAGLYAHLTGAGAGRASSPTPGCTCSECPRGCGWCRWRGPRTVPGWGW